MGTVISGDDFRNQAGEASGHCEQRELLLITMLPLPVSVIVLHPVLLLSTPHAWVSSTPPSRGSLNPAPRGVRKTRLARSLTGSSRSLETTGW